MIVLDTNVISEPLRQVPENRVTEWIDAQVLETLYLSAITVAEVRFGLASLPERTVDPRVGGEHPILHNTPFSFHRFIMLLDNHRLFWQNSPHPFSHGRFVSGSGQAVALQFASNR